MSDPRVQQLYQIIRADYMQSIKVENYREVKQVPPFHPSRRREFAVLCRPPIQFTISLLFQHS